MKTCIHIHTYTYISTYKYDKPAPLSLACRFQSASISAGVSLTALAAPPPIMHEYKYMCIYIIYNICMHISILKYFCWSVFDCASSASSYYIHIYYICVYILYIIYTHILYIIYTHILYTLLAAPPPVMHEYKYMCI